MVPESTRAPKNHLELGNSGHSRARLKCSAQGPAGAAPRRPSITLITALTAHALGALSAGGDLEPRLGAEHIDLLRGLFRTWHGYRVAARGVASTGGTSRRAWSLDSISTRVGESRSFHESIRRQSTGAQLGLPSKRKRDSAFAESLPLICFPVTPTRFELVSPA